MLKSDLMNTGRWGRSFGWSVMQHYCAQQRSVEVSRVQLYLHGGERVNRTTLIYTPFPSSAAANNQNSLMYAAPAGHHIALDELRANGEMYNHQSSETHSFPRTTHILQQNGKIERHSWREGGWLSAPQRERSRKELIQVANRLLLRRGTQSDLSTNFVRMLSQNQPHRLQNRLENYHPHGNPLLSLQQTFLRRYSQLFLSQQGGLTLPLLREHQLPGLHEARRSRRRRSKLHGLSANRGLYELRPRLASHAYLQNDALFARPQQLPMLNLLTLVSRQTLRHGWRRRRGIGLIHAMFRKSGRLIWELPMSHYVWPLSQHAMQLNEDSFTKPGRAAIVTFAPCAPYRVSVSKEDESRLDRVARAFPNLFKRAV